MKRTFCNLTILALFVLACNPAIAQKAVFTTNGGMTIGFGLGASYQQSDIANSRGAGFDFTLGSYIYKKESAFLAVDWKFRFLAGENYAHDHRINPDTTFSNIRYAFFDYDLELGLTLNRLRERTRIVLTAFAGAGITHGRTFTDLYDSDGNLYDYTSINTNQGRAQIYSDLIELSDRDYETPLVNKAAIMPTLGIFLGYQFSRSFSLGIEHKINFSINEHNSIAGINIDNNIQPGSMMDMNHYTTLGFKWNLGGGGAGSARRSTSYSYNTPQTVTRPVIPVTPPVSNPAQVVSVSPPTVDITVPAGNSYATTQGNIDISARIRNVSNRQDIQVLLNGRNVGFNYNQGSGIVSATISLNNGPNTLVVTARNGSGNDMDNVNISFNMPARINQPVVRFINPSSPLTVGNNVFNIRVHTENVKAWQDVTVTVNGNRTSNFNFNSEGVVTTNIALREGSNKIEVTGKNESGSVTGSTVITYTIPVKVVPPVIDNEVKPCPQPSLRMISPIQDGLTTDNQTYTFKTQVTNISGRNELTLTLNSRSVASYNLSGNEVTFTTTLNTGTNNFIIVAKNDCGTQTASASVIYKPPIVPVVEPQPCPQPTVNLNVVAVSRSDATHELQGTVSNVRSRSEIRVTINGNTYDAFQFVPTNGVITAALKLNPGTYTIAMIASTSCGTDSKTTSVSVAEPCVPPQVNINLAAVNRQDATHELRGTVTNVNNKNDIKVTVNGNSYSAFQFSPNTGEISASFKFNPGKYTVTVTAENDCGKDSGSGLVNIEEEKSCGPRINPGNSDWQFCLVTPKGTFTRENLTDANFSYSGPAGSLFFMPIAGGGDAIVNGKPYSIRSGQYYLFTGNLTVTVSTKNPGSMGHWSVCITSNREPEYGNGNKRPKSPCEESQDESKPKKN